MTNSILIDDHYEPIEQPVIDDAMRPVSFRAYTSDYGRLRMFAQKLRSRESEIFRFLLHIAVKQCAPLYDRHTTEQSKLTLLATLGPEFATYFNYDADALKACFQWCSTSAQAVIDDEDFELVAAFGVSQTLVRRRLNSILGRDVAKDDLRSALHDYLIDKYLPGTRGNFSE